MDSRSNGDRLRVLALVPNSYDTSPGQRFRIEQWEPILDDHGVDVVYRPFESIRLHDIIHRPGRYAEKALRVAGGLGRRLRDVTTSRSLDLVYVFREAALVGPAFLERILGRSPVPVVFDFDDAVYLFRPSPSHGALTRLKFSGKTAAMCKSATLVMAGNEHLAAYARKYNENVEVVPTTIDLEKYTPRPSRESGHTVIGWSGSHSTVAYLDALRPVFQELAEIRDFELLVIGTDEYAIQGVKVTARAWRSATEVDDLLPMDIGVMPLTDDEWSRGKCGLKALQYLALGIPAVCSPVGVNSEIIDPGVNGFLASTREEWVARLTEMIDDPGRTAEFGRMGRRTVERRYSAQLHAPRIASLFWATAGRSQVQP